MLIRKETVKSRCGPNLGPGDALGVGSGAGLLTGLVLMSMPVLGQSGVAEIAETVKLTASDGQADERFGRSIAIDGETVVVGAPFQSRGFFLEEVGAAYVFNARTGQQLEKLTAFDAEDEGLFGVSVTITGDRVIAGASRQEAAGFLAGAAYIYDSFGSTFTRQVLPVSILPQGPDAGFYGLAMDADEQFTVVAAPADVDITNGGGGAMYIYETDTFDLVAKVVSSDQAFADNFGTRVVVSGSLAVATTPFDDDLGSSSGSAYVFDAETGLELRKIVAPDGATDDFFGLGVAIDGTSLAVGAPFDDDLGSSSGSVYLFDASTGAFSRKIVAGDGLPGDRFGAAVAIENGRLIVGAPNSDPAGNLSGAVYVFDIATGEELARLVPTDLGVDSVFGGAVSASGDLVAVAAEGDGDNGALAGAAYIFDLSGLIGGCNAADIAAPFGVLDLDDIDGFIAAFGSGDAAGDIAPPFGVLDLDDIDTFIAAFSAGCP